MFTIVLTQEQLSILNSALIELPFRIAQPFIADLNKQLTEQQASHKEVAEQVSPEKEQTL